MWSRSGGSTGSVTLLGRVWWIGMLSALWLPTAVRAAEAAKPTSAEAPKEAAAVAAAPSGTAQAVREMRLEDCLAEAMKNSRRRPASQFAVAAAEAQHRQALAGYWPQVSAKGGFMRMDEPPNFLFPATQMYIPSQTLTTPAGSALVTVPAGVLGPAAVQLPVTFPGQTITTPTQIFPVPAQDVKLMDENSFTASLNAVWLLYDGGMRKGLRDQAAAGLEVARQESRRTDLEIADSVRRMYWGAVLARQLRQVGGDTLARMEATLGLTETMYKEGSGKVKKTDYLDNKVMVDSLRSMVALLEKNEEMAQAALANTMGMSWRDSVRPTDAEIVYEPVAGNLDAMVGNAYQFSPDWAKVEAGIQAAQGALKTARSGHYPKLAVTGEVHKWWNDYDGGLATRENREGWSVGVGLEFPLFEGFLIRNKISEAKAREAKIREEKILLQEGIGLMVRDTFMGLSAAQKSYTATLDAMKAAEENRDLNTRAYQNELVETEKVIRAQLVEALMTAQHLKTRYDNVALQSQLNLVIGSELWKRLQGAR